MLSQRTVVPPGFTELAGDAELAAQLGTPLFGALVRLCHLAAPSPDVPGGWCVTMSADALAAALGVTRKTSTRWCTDLVAAGLLARVEGRRLGRGLGATPTRYFVTAIPGLTAPPPSGSTPGPFSQGKVSRGTDAQVIAYPGRGSVASAETGYTAARVPDPVVDDSSKGTHHTANSLPGSSHTPAWLADALRSIGFVGDLPPDVVSAVPADKLMRVVEAVRTRPGIQSRPRYLNWLLRTGPASIDAFLADIPTAEAAADEIMLTTEEYVRLSTLHPQWKEAVRRRAEVEAAEAGIGLDLRVVLRVAALEPVEAYREAT